MDLLDSNHRNMGDGLNWLLRNGSHGRSHALESQATTFNCSAQANLFVRARSGKFPAFPTIDGRRAALIIDLKPPTGRAYCDCLRQAAGEAPN